MNMNEIPFRELLEGLGDPYLLVDDEGGVEYANPAAREVLSLGHLRGVPLSTVVDDQGFLQAWARVLREGRVLRGYPLTLRGDNRYLMASFFPVEVEGKRVVGILFRDVTRIKVLEEKDKEGLAISLVEEALGMAFHQLKGPLTGLKGAVQLMEEEEGDPLEYMRFIKREVVRLQQLVEETLDFSRPLSLEMVKTNIHRVLEEVLNAYKHQIQMQDVQVERLYDPSLPPLGADPFRLYQVFSNLVKNALEAMPQGGTLRVKTALSWDRRLLPQADALLVRVEDTGGGVPPDVEDSLFSPFVTSKVKGTGLGLSIAYKIVKCHQGHLQYGREGDWTVFEVLLPLRQGHEDSGHRR